MTVYRSRADAWLVVVLAISVGASLFAAIVVAMFGSAAAWALATLIFGLGGGLPLWVLLSTRYTLGGGQLLVRSGPFRWRIPVADITSITPTTNPLSSPALSLDRLRIDYGRGASLMISPRQRDEFVRDLEAAREGAAPG